MKHNCYNCKHRGEVPGSAHSSCNNFEDKGIVAVFVAANGCEYPSLSLNPHGVKNGWAFWPLDFDPVWVNRCNFYESNETK